MIPPKALAAQWHSTRLNLGVQGWRGRVKPLQQDKGRCHGQAPKAAGGREGMAIKKHHCASTGCFLSTMSWPCCPHHGLGHLGAIAVQGGDTSMHPPAIPLLSADQAQQFSRGKFQPRCWTRGTRAASASSGQGGEDLQDMTSTQLSLSWEKLAMGCRVLISLSHHHIAQQPWKGSGQAHCQALPDSPNISEPGRTWYSSPILFLSKIPLQLGCNFPPHPSKGSKKWSQCECA